MSLEKTPSPGRVIVISGPSGAGKTTLHDLLLKYAPMKGRIIRSISATTRSPRGSEQPGQDYLFISKKMFEYKIKANQFLEWAKVFDNHYGTPIKNVQQAIKKGKNVLLCIDVQGGFEVKKKIPSALMIFVRTTHLKELRQRLEARCTDTKESIALRLKIAKKELLQARNYDYVLVNDDLKRAFSELVDILIAELK